MKACRVLRTATLGAPPQRAQRRVVVTGLGAVTPLAANVKTSWKRILNNETATASLPADKFGGFSSTVAAIVPRGTGPDDFNFATAIDKAGSRYQSADYIAFALAAAREALEDAALLNKEDAAKTGSARFGCSIGSGIGGINEIAETAQLLATGQERKISPFFVPRILANMAQGNVAIKYGLRGPSHAPATACASGAHAIGDAFRAIKYGDADLMLAGGSESCISPIAIAGFAKARALATKFNDAPAKASRPFDSDRDGFVLAEGAAVLCLEELEHALKRGARIYCEIRGYGTCADATHITTPAGDGDGAYRCMQAALEEGGVAPHQVGHINCHATSTPVGDVIEGYGIGRLFGSAKTAEKLKLPPPPAGTGRAGNDKILVNSTKGNIGHLLGAAGAVEAVMTVLALHGGVVPPTANLDNPDPDLPTDICEFLSGKAVERKGMVAAVSNSFGFGSTNASLLFTKVD
jgi:3-oxoacyl-[acyl-carrier-protein] synthase II